MSSYGNFRTRLSKISFASQKPTRRLPVTQAAPNQSLRERTSRFVAGPSFSPGFPCKVLALRGEQPTVFSNNVKLFFRKLFFAAIQTGAPFLRGDQPTVSRRSVKLFSKFFAAVQSGVPLFLRGEQTSCLPRIVNRIFENFLGSVRSDRCGLDCPFRCGAWKLSIPAQGSTVFSKFWGFSL